MLAKTNELEKKETVERLESLRYRATGKPPEGAVVSDAQALKTAISYIEDEVRREEQATWKASLKRVYSSGGNTGVRPCALAAGELILAKIQFEFRAVASKQYGTDYELWVGEADKQKAEWTLELFERRRPGVVCPFAGKNLKAFVCQQRSCFWCKQREATRRAQYHQPHFEADGAK